MTLWQEYRKPSSITEAINDLLTAPPPTSPVAGGTDLILDIKQGRHPAVHTLVDLTEVPELNTIEQRDGELYIGAAVPINRLTANRLLNDHAQALIEACHLIAGPQVRNTATLGGNIAHALPAADGTIALTALDAQVEIADKNGLHRNPLSDIFKGPGISGVEKTAEIIAGFYLPLCGQNNASSFKRIMRPQGVALPILNCAVWVCRNEAIIRDIRIAIGPGGPVPFRATEAEHILKDSDASDEVLFQSVEAILQQVKFRTSPHRATMQYRQHIINDLFRETFQTAWQRTFA